MGISASARKGWLAASVVGALVLGACSSGSDSSEGDATKITWWFSTSAQDQGYTDLAKEFKAKEGIDVEIVNVPNDGYQDKLRQAAQANSLPDAASVPSLDTIWVNQLQDLSDIANNATNKINKTYVTEQDGKVLTIPSDVTAAGLFINKSLFEKAGVTYPTDPASTWTWDEFLAAATKVRDASGAKYDLVYDNSPARIRAWIYTRGG
jgi:alpha-1,4-digalacturonate transport system substrate-binding protein